MALSGAQRQDVRGILGSGRSLLTSLSRCCESPGACLFLLFACEAGCSARWRERDPQDILRVCCPPSSFREPSGVADVWFAWEHRHSRPWQSRLRDPSPNHHQDCSGHVNCVPATCSVSQHQRRPALADVLVAAAAPGDRGGGSGGDVAAPTAPRTGADGGPTSADGQAHPRWRRGRECGCPAGNARREARRLSQSRVLAIPDDVAGVENETNRMQFTVELASSKRLGSGGMVQTAGSVDLACPPILFALALSSNSTQDSPAPSDCCGSDNNSPCGCGCLSTTGTQLTATPA